MLHQVGVGALGPVFRTYEPTRDRLVAVKVFRLDVTPEQAQSLADELSTAADAGLFHPSIVEPVAAGVEGTVAYRAEEYVAAETLDVALRHYAPAPIDTVLPLITQLAGAIDFARTAGVGHGALHPRDIFVTPDEARATGFGVVEALERVGLRAPVRRPYSAPERVSGGTWSTPADVFSLAAIAYELLTGRRPAGTGEQIGTVAGTSAGAHPGALHAVFVQAMDEDPARRYQTALGFASALDAAARGEVPMATYERGAAGAAPVTSAATVVRAAKSGPPVPPARDARADEPLAEEALDVVADDVVADEVITERQEDDARLALLTDEADEDEDADPVEGERSLFDGDALEDLTLDAPANQTQRFADEFGAVAVDATGHSARRTLDIPFDHDDDLEEPPAAVSGRGSVPYRHAAPSSDDDDRRAPEYVPISLGEPVDHDRPRSLMLPIALALMLGLLIGAGAYAWFTRAPAATEPAGDSAQAATASDPAKPYSEETIAPSAGAASGSAAAPVSAGEPPPVVAATTPPANTEKPAAAPPREDAPATGRVVISSTPRGAGVTVDGQWRGRTPLTLDEVPFGSHQVRVVQPGYATQNERVTLSAGTPARTLSFTLRRTPAAAPPSRPAARTQTARPPSFTGAIYVDSRPRGARVLLDGKNIGTTPMRIPDVRIGSHIIKLQLEDHSDWTSSTRVVSGQESRVSGSLERIR